MKPPGSPNSTPALCRAPGSWLTGGGRGGRVPPRPLNPLALWRPLGWLALVFWCVLVGSAEPPGPTVQAEYDEYKVKAAFLHRFPLFVEWPDRAFASPQAPFVIGVLGRDPFGPRLETVISNKIVRGRSFTFHRLDRVEDVAAARCHILFISRSERERVPEILLRLRNTPILTVGDTPGFGAEGVMVNFFIRDRSVRFEINREAAAKAGLKLDSQLLSLGERPRKPPPGAPD